MKKIPIIPDCYKHLPGDTLLNSRDVAKMFGCKTPSSITSYYQRGNIPKPDKSLYSSLRGHPNMNNYWKLATIRDWGKVE